MGAPQLQQRILEGCQHVLLEEEQRVITLRFLVGLKVLKAAPLVHRCP